jgi:hypothetical protein
MASSSIKSPPLLGYVRRSYIGCSLAQYYRPDIFATTPDGVRFPFSGPWSRRQADDTDANFVEITVVASLLMMR